jgi:mannose-6-phosphate isomerase class I
MDMTGRSNYDRAPSVEVPGHGCDVGWSAIAARLGGVVAVECYPGVDELEIIEQLAHRLMPALVVHTGDAMRPADEIERLVEPFLGGDDPVFGFMSCLAMDAFFDAGACAALAARVHSAPSALIVGAGASLIAPQADILVYADLARWEAQLRFRRGETGNFGADNRSIPAGLKYKRAYFVDWRVADQFKRPLLSRADYFLDTNDPARPKLARGSAVREGLRRAAGQPFRVVPFFDPAPWGGQWMKRVCDLNPGEPNYGWCFDCVPEENSLYLGFGDVRNFELPSLDLVFQHPRELLGEAVQARFGDEFPIRFDFLDTMGGGNLSLQVHPLTEYIRQTFGMRYTQDESYYLLDALPDATVYLGLKSGVDPAEMLAALEAAQTGGPPFVTDRYVNRWPARKHDHFLIPAGTIHCSGANSMVLEISATPYIFTFKLWDWDRPGLDGAPRPIHLQHGREVIQWDRNTEWTRRELVNRIEPVAQGEGWTEERTGLHDLEFIETRRHWFTAAVPHDTHGGVNVLNLVEGREAVIESPTGAFPPFTVHYAETFIVPASVGPYTIRPGEAAADERCATIKACIRT